MSYGQQRQTLMAGPRIVIEVFAIQPTSDKSLLRR
jgi:hypothetical protein